MRTVASGEDLGWDDGRVPVERYQRFDLRRPEFLADEHWDSISSELERLGRALDAEDDGQVLGDIKCLVESVAKTTLDINGTPAAPDAAFDTTVNQAHTLLAKQPGHELAYKSDFGNIATQSSKIARSLGNIRNEYGAGHGRARQPRVRDEMVDLALDGGLTWVRWALRRLGYFSEGRPDQLIRDLVDKPQNFYRGILTRRLEAANLSALEERHQRALGVAVGQRANRGTFVVQEDGVDPCLKSDSTNPPWTRNYRMGLAQGLWFETDDKPTMAPDTIRSALTVLDPVADCAEVLTDLVDRVVTNTPPGLPEVADREAVSEVARYVRDRATGRPEPEHKAHDRLANHLGP